MLIDYVTAAGEEIKYDTGSGLLCQADLNDIAFIYAQKHPMILPDTVFMRVNVLTEFVKMTGNSLSVADINNTPTTMLFYSGCGILAIKPLPWGWQGPEVLVGIKADFDKYDIDAIFEKIVLKDCERE